MEKKSDFRIVKEKIIKTDELLEQFRQRDNELKKLRPAFSDMEAKYKRVELEIGKLKFEKDRFQFNYNELLEKHEPLVKERKELLEQHSALQLRFSSISKDIQDKYEVTLSELNESKRLIKKQEKLLVNQENRKVKSENVEKLKNQITKLVDENEALTLEVQDLRKRIAVLQINLSKSKSVEEDLAATQLELRIVQEDCKKHENSMEKLTSDLNIEKTLRINLEKDVEKLNKQLEDYAQQSLTFKESQGNVAEENDEISDDFIDKIFEEIIIRPVFSPFTVSPVPFENLDVLENRTNLEIVGLENMENGGNWKIEEIGENVEIEENVADVRIEETLEDLEIEENAENRKIEENLNLVDEEILESRKIEETLNLENEGNAQNRKIGENIVDLENGENPENRKIEENTFLENKEKAKDRKIEDLENSEAPMKKIFSTTSGTFTITTYNNLAEISNKIRRRKIRRRTKKSKLVSVLSALNKANVQFMIHNKPQLQLKESSQFAELKVEKLGRCFSEVCNYRDRAVVRSNGELLGFVHVKKEKEEPLGVEKKIGNYFGDSVLDVLSELVAKRLERKRKGNMFELSVKKRWQNGEDLAKNSGLLLQNENIVRGELEACCKNPKTRKETSLKLIHRMPNLIRIEEQNGRQNEDTILLGSQHLNKTVNIPEQDKEITQKNLKQNFEETENFRSNLEKDFDISSNGEGRKIASDEKGKNPVEIEEKERIHSEETPLPDVTNFERVLEISEKEEEEIAERSPKTSSIEIEDLQKDFVLSESDEESNNALQKTDEHSEQILGTSEENQSSSQLTLKRRYEDKKTNAQKRNKGSKKGIGIRERILRSCQRNSRITPSNVVSAPKKSRKLGNETAPNISKITTRSKSEESKKVEIKEIGRKSPEPIELPPKIPRTSPRSSKSKNIYQSVENQRPFDIDDILKNIEKNNATIQRKTVPQPAVLCDIGRRKVEKPAIEENEEEILENVTMIKNKTQLPPSKVDQLFDKLINFGTEEKAVNEVVSQFVGQIPEYIAQAVLRRIAADPYDKAETSTNSFTPILTLSQKIFLGFMYKLEKLGVEGICDNYLRMAERRLITLPTLNGIIPISRIYLSICKLRNDLDRMRRFSCEVFYFCGDLALPFFFTVLTSWNEVLPKADEAKNMPIANALVYIIFLKTCNMVGYNVQPLQDLIRRYYGYDTEKMDTDEIFQRLFTNYLKNPGRSTSFPILLFCKNNSDHWVNEQIEKCFKPVVDQVRCENFKATCILLVGHLSTRFSSKAPVNYIEGIRTWLRSLMQQTNCPEIVKQSVLFCLKRLRKK